MKTGIIAFIALSLGLISALTFLKPGPSHPPPARSGKKIYQKVCSNCHQVGLVGAPKISDHDAWQERKKDRSIDDLHQNVINGLGSMPQRGMCPKCTDEELKNTIQYMLERAQ